MAHPFVSKRRAAAFSTALFLLGLAAISILGNWWPGILVPIGLSLALRQYLLGRRYDMIVSLVVFLGAFITMQFNISWEVFLPMLFSLGAFYVLCSELIESNQESEEEKEEEINHEIEEDKKKK